MARFRKTSTAEKLRDRWQQWSDWIRDNVPPGARTLLGLLLIVGGVFGILPVLGFWMLPLGVAVLAMDIVPLARAVMGRNGKQPSNQRDGHKNPRPEDPSETGRPGPGE